MVTTNLNTVNVTAQYLDYDGNPLTGTVVFTPSTIVIDVPGKKILFPKSYTASLNANGQMSIAIPASDDPDVLPNIFTYSIQENVTNGRKLNGIQIPYSAISSGFDLSQILVDGTVTAPTYVTSGSVGATATVLGVIKLTGALGGTADAPTTPTAVHLTGNEIVDGIKTFNNSPVVPTPTNGNQSSNKSYSDGKIPKGDKYYNVVDYGAVGDEVTDDTVAFTNAMNAADAAGGIVYIPSAPNGRYYRIAGTLPVLQYYNIEGVTPPKVNSFGVGRYGAAWWFTAGFHPHGSWIYFDRTSGYGLENNVGGTDPVDPEYPQIRLHNIGILGKGTGTFTGVRINKGMFSTIENVDIVNCNTGLHIRDTYWHLYNNLHCHGNSRGIFIDRCTTARFNYLQLHYNITGMEMFNSTEIGFWGGSTEDNDIGFDINSSAAGAGYIPTHTENITWNNFYFEDQSSPSISVDIEANAVNTSFWCCKMTDQAAFILRAKRTTLWMPQTTTGSTITLSGDESVAIGNLLNISITSNSIFKIDWNTGTVELPHIFTSGVVVKNKNGPIVDSDLESQFGIIQSGTIGGIDTANNRLYIKVGTTWKYATLT